MGVPAGTFASATTSASTGTFAGATTFTCNRTMTFAGATTFTCNNRTMTFAGATVKETYGSPWPIEQTRCSQIIPRFF